MKSTLFRQEVCARIKAGTKLGLSPVAAGVTGGVWFGHVRLVWSVPLFSNGFRPVLSGNLKETRHGTTLNASYGASAFLRVFFTFWYIVLTIFVLTGVAMLFQPEKAEDAAWLMAPMILLLGCAPIVFHAIFNRNANTHFEAMLQHLGDLADLRPETHGR